VHGEVDVVTGTLGKALGGAAGGFVAASKPVIALMSQLARPGLFSNALPVTVACSARAALSPLRSDPGRVARLHEVADRLRTGLRDAGLRPLDSASAIVPIIVGETADAIRMSQSLRDDHGVLVTGFGYPVVPEGTARLRLQASSAFTDADIGAVVHAVASVAP
jgi:glycine C-acetyltransferase